MAKRKKKRNLNNLLLNIVIPVYGVSFLYDVLDAIPEACKLYKYRITLVDDNSPEDSALNQLLEESGKLSNISVIRNKQNLGFAGTCNKGANHNKAEYYLFLNSDVILEPDSIDLALGHMMNNIDTGVLGFKLLFPPDGTKGVGDTIQHCGICFDINGYPQHANIGWPKEHPLVNVTRPVQAVTGAAMMVRGSDWAELPKFYDGYGDSSTGFNVNYGKGTYEDIELCIIIRNVFKKHIIYFPEAVGYHYVGSSVNNNDGFPLTRNHSLFINRCKGMFYYDEYLFY